jgi:1-aminocyclopropane-1-carboxylate deaminase
MNYNTTIQIADINELVFTIKDKLFVQKKITVAVLRLDEIHKAVSGNKWFKLKYFLLAAVKHNCSTIITYGGVWSNHIIATAAACNLMQLKCIAYIRSDESLVTKTLQHAKDLGMQVKFITRQEYKLQKNNTGVNTYNLQEFYIPEGGLNEEGIKGATEILNFDCLHKYTHIMCPIGTGTTFAGLVNRSLKTQKVIGINALKGGSFQIDALKPFLLNHNFTIINDYHFGGFAKCNQVLIDFMNSWYTKTKIPTDFIYTAKMFFGLMDLMQKDFFKNNDSILMVHTGGLQGNLSLAEKDLIF